MSPSTPAAERNQALVAALQWGLVQAFVLDTAGRFLQNYYRATTDAFFAPGWVTSIQFAAPLGLLVGAVGGYRWVRSGRGATTESAHRNRVVFVGTLLAGWGLAIVPTLALQSLLGDQFWTIPYFALPTAFALLAGLGAVVLAYRVDAAVYRQRRDRLVGAVQGAFLGLVLGMVGFALYGSYLVATRDNVSLDGGPGIVAAVCLGAIAGYALADRHSTDRAAEFLVLLVLSTFGLTIAVSVGTTLLAAVGLGWGVSWSAAPLVLSTVAALLLSGYLAYGVKTTVYKRLVGAR
jgi:hypothetical protein